MRESSKTENVDISKLLTDIDACAQDVQQLIAMETNTTRRVSNAQLYCSGLLKEILSSSSSIVVEGRIVYAVFSCASLYFPS